ncbi:hypothetical protein RSOL_448270 [Rhizoctonia solani AG-3 Rhs1AP]|uniref:Uncharacterized protein n=2 Tax=Rhizoctonia solani AG-3 TaxID=1086053 RepID=A0A074S3L1_9AGAM|nr:hypothetical protein RSOL_448270 [Rhizoctonia solani AG-3 Rhs1AP]KEP52140.1 hypothetical protein V565_049970 [Rhizoctonia solani 123E]
MSAAVITRRLLDRNLFLRLRGKSGNLQGRQDQIRNTYTSWPALCGSSPPRATTAISPHLNWRFGGSTNTRRNRALELGGYEGEGSTVIPLLPESTYTSGKQHQRKLTKMKKYCGLGVARILRSGCIFRHLPGPCK